MDSYTVRNDTASSMIELAKLRLSPSVLPYVQLFQSGHLGIHTAFTDQKGDMLAT